MPRSRKSKRQTSQQSNPGAEKLIYTGPIKNSRDKAEDDTVTAILSWTGVLDSDGAGAMTDVLTNDVSASADFASYSNIYDEYRPLGERLEYFPYNRYSKTTTTCTPLIVVKDRNDTLALSSYSSAISYSSAAKRSLEDPWSEEFKMKGATEGTFISTASTHSTRAFKFYADGLSTSTNYGRYFLYVRVQFRGRK